MGERYYITGVQIGMLYAYLDLKQFDKVKKLIQEIEESQFVGSLDPETQTLEIMEFPTE